MTTLTKKLVAPAKPTKIPVSSNDLQFNFCKNPTCANFGVKPPVTLGTKKGYTIYKGSKNAPLLKCKCCGEQPPLKSNKGIVDEIERISSYLYITGMKSFVSCPDEECDNHTVPYGTKKAYRSFGTAASGAKRIQCAICDTTFSIPKPTQRQRKTHYNIDIFKLLMNKVPLSRIVDILGISWEVLYNRIDFIHAQCLAFVANRENKLRDMSIDRLYLSIDKQEYEINWTDRKDKRSIVLAAMASADNTTGYVFGIHPNFDSTMDKETIEADALKIDDANQPDPLKKYARLWLEADYIRARQIAKAKSAKTKAKSLSSTLTGDIANAYNEAQLRDDIEVFDEKTEEEKLPSYGMQVRAEYTMIAHFYFLKNMMGNVGAWRFFLDQESGIRSACLGAFNEEIAEHRAEAFYVRIEKHLMVGEKRRLKEVAKSRFDQIWKTIMEPTYEKVKLEMLKDTIRSVIQIGHYKDRWIHHPLPSMSEANKAMCWLTEHNEFDDDHKARLYSKASLHGIDTFFEKIRRRMSMFERPIHSASNEGRTWNGYSAYNPAMIVKLLEIFRVTHNYIDFRKEEDGTITTPATRLGLAQVPLDYRDILYYGS